MSWKWSRNFQPRRDISNCLKKSRGKYDSIRGREHGVSRHDFENDWYILNLLSGNSWNKDKWIRSIQRTIIIHTHKDTKEDQVKQPGSKMQYPSLTERQMETTSRCWILYIKSNLWWLNLQKYLKLWTQASSWNWSNFYATRN